MEFQYRLSGFHDNSKEILPSFVLSQNSKSITHLLHMTPRGQRNHREVLMTSCAVLSFLAICLNDIPAAGTHVFHGLRIMEEWESTTNFYGSPVGPVLSHAIAKVELKHRVCTRPILLLQEDNRYAGESSCIHFMSASSTSSQTQIMRLSYLRSGTMYNTTVLKIRMELLYFCLFIQRYCLSCLYVYLYHTPLYVY